MVCFLLLLQSHDILVWLMHHMIVPIPCTWSFEFVWATVSESLKIHDKFVLSDIV
jgi:hypothetical protein